MKTNTANCHECGDPFSTSTGCPERVVICEKCRQDLKKLKAAREAMIEHLKEAHEYVWK